MCTPHPVYTTLQNMMNKMVQYTAIRNWFLIVYYDYIFKGFLTESTNYNKILILPIKEYITLFYFRYYHPTTFYGTASTNYVNSRKQDIQRDDPTRDDLFIVNTPDRNTKDLGQKVLGQWLGDPGDCSNHDSTEEDYMDKFLAKSQEDLLPKIDGLDMENLLPGGAPLISYLKFDSQAIIGGYQYHSTIHLEKLASYCSVDKDSLMGVEVKEITLGRSNEDRVSDVLDWAIQKMKENFTTFPGEACSFHVEEFVVPIWKYNELRRAQENLDANHNTVIFSVPRPKQPNGRSLPSRILIGDGITWVVSIRFNFDIINDKGCKKYKLTPSSLPDVFFSFLKTLPYLQGEHALQSRNPLKDTLFNIFGISATLPSCLNTQALSIAAGWRSSNTDMFTMNLITLGGLVNTEIKDLDFLKCLEWKNLPNSLKIYSLGLIRSGYSTYVVLMSLLMRNVFPDIDMLCSSIELRQPEAIWWFAWMVAKCLGDTSLDVRDKVLADNREDLIKSLRRFVENSEESYLQRRPDELICLLAQLIPDWPTVVHGGPRFLQSIHPFFVEQIRILQGFKINHPRLQPCIMREIDETFIRSCTYNRGVRREDVYEGCEYLGLECKPSLEIKVYNLNMSDLSNEILTVMATQTGQAKVPGILEFARLHPQKINALLSSINRMDLDQIPVPIWLE